MADQPPPSTPPPPSTAASTQTQLTSSYIYPVRSLLSGIQPAPESDVQLPPEPNVLLAGLRRDAQVRTERQAQLPPSSQAPPKTSSPGLGARRGMAPQGTLPIARSSLPFMRDESVFSAPLPTMPEASSPTFFSTQSQSSSPLARRQSAADSPEMGTRRIVSGLESRSLPADGGAHVTSPSPPPSSAPEPFRHYPAEGRDGFLRLAHLPEGASAQAQADQLSNTDGLPIMMHDSVDGAVIRSSMHGGSKASKSGTGTGTGTGTSNAGTDASRAGSAHPSGAGSMQPPSASGAGSAPRSGMSSAQPSAPGGVPLTQVTSRSGTTSLSETSDEPLVTVRFQHVQDENGHHVVVGREGRLARCEDEPIRVPGAVQGFGVLIAIEEDYETGNLVVRQVSENASELLGLTPRYLFSLDCFTQTLPDSQADILWDNVQFLHDPELDANDTSDDSPQVFLLSGWGEPGSGLREGGYFAQGAFGPAQTGDRVGPRREWTCWCAAHRPKRPQKARDFPLDSEGSSTGGYPDPNQFDDEDPDTSPLIVLEFELERDVFNPLYPPYNTALPIESPGASSRGSGSTPGNASGGTRSAGTGSGRTKSSRTGGTSGTGGTSRTADSRTTQQQQQGTPKQNEGGKSASQTGSVPGSRVCTPVESGVCEPAGSRIVGDSIGCGAPAPIGDFATPPSREVEWPGFWLPWLVIRWVLFLFVPILTRTPVVVVGKDDEDSLSTDPKDKPTGIGHDAIEGTKAEDGATGRMVGEGLTKAEIVVPVVVGRTNEGVQEGGEGVAQEQDAAPTAVPATTPATEKGEIETPGDGGQSSAETAKQGNSGGMGQSSGGTTVTSGNANVPGERGTVTDPSSGITPTRSGSLGGNDSADSALSPSEIRGLVGDDSWYPSPEDVIESTTSRSRPLRALERMRRITREPGPRRHGRGSQGGGGGGGVGTMDVFAVLAQVNDQLGSAPDLDSFLKVVVGVIKDLTQFHRVLVYQFDEQWNGQVVAELVDWSQTHDLFKGLHFPAADIPAQARELYTINKVRLLYDREQTTARLVVRDRSDLENPLDMTHSCLRAMSPIHIKYLGNMGVRASMSISIVTFGQLWGLIACHSYGPHGMRVSFPVRQMLRLLSDSISRNIERLSYAQRLHTRKLISTVPTEQHPTGYIVSDAEDLISLFDADFGVLVIGEGAKILGANEHGQETLIVAEYLRLKQFNLMQVSQAIAHDFPDLKLPAGHDVIAGLLYVPLSAGGKDFIALMRKGQLRDVHWAGKPFKTGSDGEAVLEPRKSFRAWKETVSGRCRAWTDEQLETAGVLALVYGKFIEVWRQKEMALKTNQLTNLLLSNASHEVRTPLNHIINYLEMALNGPLDSETRENLTRSHMASRSLLFTINDLLDLTRHETGNETSFNEPFDLPGTVEDAVTLYRIEAMRRQIQFIVDTSDCPQMVIGDSKKIRTVVSNLTANAVKYTDVGQINVECRRFKEPVGLRDSKEVAVEIVVADTGCGISSAKLESIFREFEQVESSMPRSGEAQGLGLGLAVVARIVEQLGGQLRVDSKPQQGSRFSFLIPFALPDGSASDRSLSPRSAKLITRSRRSSIGSAYASAASASVQSANSRIDDIVDAISAPMGRICSVSSSRNSRPSPPVQRSSGSAQPARTSTRQANPPPGVFEVESSRFPVRGVKVDEFDADRAPSVVPSQAPVLEQAANRVQKQLEQSVSVGVGKRGGKKSGEGAAALTPLRILVVEDDDTNRKILCKRLVLDGHEVQHTTNGQEAVQKVEGDREWDCVLMDIQMPILDGFGATRAIRKLETESPAGGSPTDRVSMRLNGRIPIFAVSASLREKQREEMHDLGMDGWILKPIGFDRLRIIMKGITDLEQRQRDKYQPGKWEAGGWLGEPNPILRVQH